MSVTTVDVPAPFVDIFERAEEYARRYFGAQRQDPTCGTIEISGERYILMRAAAMSIEFTELLSGIYREGTESEARLLAANLLFDLGHAIGKSDAAHFHAHMQVTDPIERLSIGPVQFAFSGWASVKIDPNSRVMPVSYTHLASGVIEATEPPSVQGFCAALQCEQAQRIPSDFDAVSDHCPVVVTVR